MRAILILLAFLAGCAGTPVVQEVQVPVMVPCLEERPVRPKFTLDKLPLDASDHDLLISLWIERLERKLYESRLETAMAGCI